MQNRRDDDDDGRERTIAIVAERCDGDTIRYDRVVQLGFGSPVGANRWTGTQDLVDPSGEPAPSAVAGGDFQPLKSPAVTPIHVVLDDNDGGPTSVDVVDESGRLVSATAGPQVGGNGLEAFDATNDDAMTGRLAWPGRPCDTVHRLTIDPTVTTLTLDAPSCFGDSIGVERFLVLTFDGPVDAKTLKTRFFSGRGGVNMPTWTTAAPDANDGQYRLTLADPGYVVESLPGGFDLERRAVGAGATGIVVDQVGPTTVRLVWNGPSCATDFALAIDPRGNAWTLTSEPCETSTTVLRMVDVAFNAARSVETITVETRFGQP